MQSYGKEVYLLPAFPEDWSVSFLLNTPCDNKVSGLYQAGKWIVEPTFEKKTELKIKK